MINKVILLGYVGQDPQTINLESGNTLVKCSLATSESWKDKEGNKQESTEWHNLVVWGNLTKIFVPYVRKGSLIYVEGKIVKNEYEMDGEKKSVTNINVQSVRLVSSKDKLPF